MNDAEFDLLRTLTIGDKEARLMQLSFIKITDHNPDQIVAIMEETSTLMKEVAEFYKSYSNNIQANNE